MTGRGEPSHVGADLGDDHVRDDVTHSRDRRQQLNSRLDRRQRFSHVCIDLPQRRVDRVDHLHVELKHRAVMRCDATTKCLDQGRSLLPGMTLRQIGETLGSRLAVDERLQHGATALADDARQHAVELDVRVLEHLLDPQRVL